MDSWTGVKIKTFFTIPCSISEKLECNRLSRDLLASLLHLCNVLFCLQWMLKWRGFCAFQLLDRAPWHCLLCVGLRRQCQGTGRWMFLCAEAPQCCQRLLGWWVRASHPALLPMDPFPSPHLSGHWNSSTAASAACWVGQAQQGSGLGNYLCLPETGVPLLLISSWAGPSQCCAKQWYDGNRTGHRRGCVSTEPNLKA